MNHHEVRQTPKRSLLSTSLARERNLNSNNNNQYSNDQQSSSTLNHHHSFFNIHELMDDDINNNNDNETIRDHPEPQLLASSVGKDLNGKLIPSSSTISLLSLGQDSQYSQNLQLQQNQQNQSNNQQQQQQPPILIRQNSNNRSYLNLQRLQQYQRSTTSSQQQQQYSENISNINSNSEYITIPNSPNLDPTSVGNSPSRFWLSSQTPPFKIKPLYQYVTHKQTNENNTNNNNISKSTIIEISDSQGDKSPQLNPVQTPLEDPPMTPLFLNGQYQQQQVRSDYFGNLQEHVEEEEEEEDDEMSDEMNHQRNR
ncbi:uncharacterized protein KGF55_001375 [Candida pseudojiufengensis]|uniref:uncharacterized protein n=1 Tax=Candida pseudojiufengensis TaxID=497109 RepID=UPI002224223E|nr:uncharacterized protein KGF55_001375 [Candida pseudojiufengensis]KAI5965155.1 hypothetical protein KGF55_001375 [Candida pseudojiufengensis]